MCEHQTNEGGIGDINFPLVSDLDRSISTYTVLKRCGGAVIIQKGIGQATFLIDRERIVRHMVANDELGRDMDELFRMLQACSFLKNMDRYALLGGSPVICG